MNDELDVSETRVAETAAALERWCRENGHIVLAGDRVFEDAAALILDRAPGTLANWRSNGGAVVPFYRSRGRGRVTYRLRDLARYLEQQRVDVDDEESFT